jgi:Domain of Unknown Function with PDB structure (DUF3857)/Transglutaminase-like superfamily
MLAISKAVNWRLAGRVAVLAAVVLAMGAKPMRASDDWIKPTPEELKMTSLPGYPGAPAVMLFREEITKDDLHVVQHYERIKVLTEKGKERANVELRFASTSDYDYYSGDEKTVTDIMGRTIHPDGTIIPFTGKPYTKTLEKGNNFKYQARMFTLPDVEVGSIIEYRYSTRISDSVVEAPSWYIQDDIFTRTVHFVWWPTDRELSSEEGMVSTITWFPILPAGVTLDHHETPGGGPNGSVRRVYEVTAHDVAPMPEEEFMPPIRSFTYRVLFAYSPYHSGAEFWKAKGKSWSKQEDSFIGPDNTLKAATQTVTAGAQTQDEKLRKIYAAVMALENTDFTRDRGKKEDQAQGLGKVSSAGDVYKHGRGSSDQLTAVFIGMARAAGMKAYAMIVPDRSKRMLTPLLMSFNQFDNTIAIVTVDGKEQFFDPGQRYCPYGHLAWENTMIGGLTGLRQTDKGTDFAGTPGEPYTATKTSRIGDLIMDEHGEVKGTITLSYTGSVALRWRQRALRGDEESLKHGLRTSLEEMLPKTMEVKVQSVENLTDYEKPLVVNFEVKGGLGTATGKRMILPADVFLTEDVATFPHEKREMPVYFNYPQSVLDAVRIKFPATMSLEAAPTETKVKFQDIGLYSLTAAPAANSVTVRRSFLFNTVLIPIKDYGDLRSFYSQMETKDKESVVLKVAPQSASAAEPAGN